MKLHSNFLLLLAAAIWGFAFVAQRIGADYIGAFTFNGVRFALGSLSLLPLVIFYKKASPSTDEINNNSLQAGILAGMILFIAASLQQIGMLYTTAGKAAFITGLYIVLVPLMGIFLKKRISINSGLGSVLAIVGLYFLCIKEGFSISSGDLFQLIAAFFWTAHILIIDTLSRKVNALKLAFFQFLTCSVLSTGTALIIETITLKSILEAGVPILYGGICSVGIAYTLQIIGQKNASPAHASIILSMETVFAMLGGYLILHEQLGPRELSGCALMMAGMLITQLQIKKPQKDGVLANTTEF